MVGLTVEVKCTTFSRSKSGFCCQQLSCLSGEWKWCDCKFFVFRCVAYLSVKKLLNSQFSA